MTIQNQLPPTVVNKIDASDEVLYDQRHGGPYDRGGADSYYRRGYNPHYFLNATYSSTKVELADMTVEDIVAYTAGYNANEELGYHKEW